MTTDNNINARQFLLEIGVPLTVVNGGPVSVLKALNSIGINPVDQKVHGAGIAFFISKDARDNYINSKTKQISNECELSKNRNSQHKKIRVVARALLHLYDLLGEEPPTNSDLRKVAER